MKLGKREKRRVVYWDSCVFLAWIKEETLWGQDVMDGMAQVVEQSAKNQAIIITSVLTKTEVLESQLTEEQRKKFNAVFGHRNVVLLDLDQRISDEAARIRGYYKKPHSRTMSVPDSIHLATALHYNAHEFHTLDGSSRRKRAFDLLALNGNVADARLYITKPTFIPPPPPLEGPLPADVEAKQQALPLEEGTSDENETNK